MVVASQEVCPQALFRRLDSQLPLLGIPESLSTNIVSSEKPSQRYPRCVLHGLTVEQATRIEAKIAVCTYALLINRVLGRSQGYIKESWA